jgi:hypothetical protein
MAEDALLTITLSKSGDSFRADLQAPSGINGVGDLRLRSVRPDAVEAIEACLEELQSKAADGNEIALRFT